MILAQTGNISETVDDRAKISLLLMVYIKSYTGFRLPRKCMTLNDLCVRFSVIDSINAAKMAKYSLVMTRRHVEYKLSVRPAHPLIPMCNIFCMFGGTLDMFLKFEFQNDRSRNFGASGGGGSKFALSH